MTVYSSLLPYFRANQIYAYQIPAVLEKMKPYNEVDIFVYREHTVVGPKQRAQETCPRAAGYACVPPTLSCL